MKIRDHFHYKSGNREFLVKKDENTYKSSYSVCMFVKSTDISCRPYKASCPTREAALKELKRLLTVYTCLTKSQIARL